VLTSGVISKYNVGLGFHVSLHNRDASVIKDIKSKLNDIGTYNESKTKPEARLAVNDRKSLMSLIEIFNMFPLITQHQLKRYLLLKEYLLKDIREFKTLEDYNEFKDKTSLDLDLNTKFD
jgi:hypothetical protein